MSKYLIEDTGYVVDMTKSQTVEVFNGIINLIDSGDRCSLLKRMINMLTKSQKAEILNYCCRHFPNASTISLIENAIIEED